METINFDEHFADALNEWIERYRKKFKHTDEMEDAATDYYLQWLDQPADWLDGQTPGTYFQQFSDTATLIGLLCAYVDEQVPVPDPLLDRIAELENEEPILALARDKTLACEARMYAIDLLRQRDSRAPMVDYIRWQVERDDDDDLLDNALDSLRAMGEDIRRPAKIAFMAADDAGKEALLDVLADFPCDEDVLGFALTQFRQQPDKLALYAGYLGKLGDDRALEPLCEAAEKAGIHYIDFIEVRNAIERLGGEAPFREFSEDPTYLAVQELQER